MVWWIYVCPVIKDLFQIDLYCCMQLKLCNLNQILWSSLQIRNFRTSLADFFLKISNHLSSWRSGACHDIYTYIYIHTYIYECIMYICTYMYMFIFICIYIHVHMDIYDIYVYSIYIINIIYIYNTVTCLEYSIIMTTENTYICTVRKSRHYKHKVM